jgi:hypothetical protein
MDDSPPDTTGNDHGAMAREKITLRAKDSNQPMEVVVLNKRAEVIQVIVVEGTHSVLCELTPTRNALAYAGKALGRVITYERSRAQVESDIDSEKAALRDSKGR